MRVCDFDLDQLSSEMGKGGDKGELREEKRVSKRGKENN